jgi:hypothetical protein
MITAILCLSILLAERINVVRVCAIVLAGDYNICPTALTAAAARARAPRR